MPKIAQEYTLQQIYDLLKTSASNAGTSLLVAQGLFPGIKSFKKFGRNNSVGTTAVPIIMSGYYRTPTAETALEILSSDANDNQAGSGARQVTIVGLDGNWNEISQKVSMDGVAAVAIPKTMRRVYDAWVSSSGTYATQASGSHVGTITIRESGGGQTWNQIGIMNSFPVGQTLAGCYTVPANYTLFVNEYSISVENSKTPTVMLFERENCNITSEPFSAMRLKETWEATTGFVEQNESQFNIYPQFTDVGFMGYVGAGTASVSVNFSGFLVNNNYIKDL